MKYQYLISLKEKLNIVKILQDQNQLRHKRFEDRDKGSPQSSTLERLSNPSPPEGIKAKKNSKESTSNTSSKSKPTKKRGPRATKFAIKCKSRSQSRYKRRNGMFFQIFKIAGNKME